MKVSFPHRTTRAKALEELKTHSSRLIERFGSGVSELQQEWLENQLTVSFETFGFAIQGSVVVEESTIEVEIDLPWLARTREGQIRDRVIYVLQEILEPGPCDKGQNV
ncbi:MAG: polyhydroxyalkanoic acid system family protein [Dehalococcoidia bacterium]|jgi:hypothetical protein|nr:polyhydroxyalkanoic acid system family protein [Dehalococcoidia bacterium]